MRRENDLLHKACNCRQAGITTNWIIVVATGIVMLGFAIVYDICVMGVS